MRTPPDGRRRRAFGDVRANVEPAVAGTTAEELHRAADAEVHIGRGDVERDGADRLVGVEQDDRTVPVRGIDDRCEIEQRRRAEVHEAHRDDRGPVVDRRTDPIHVDGSAVRFERDDDELAVLTVPERREFAMAIPPPDRSRCAVQK